MNIEEIKALLMLVYYPEYTFIASIDGRGEMFLRASYMEADVDKPLGSPLEEQLTRKWFLSPYMSKSEVVQTAFKCIITSMEHRVREHFHYRGALVFGPHFNIDDLWELAANTKPERR